MEFYRFTSIPMLLSNHQWILAVSALRIVTIIAEGNTVIVHISIVNSVKNHQYRYKCGEVGNTGAMEVLEYEQ